MPLCVCLYVCVLCPRWELFSIGEAQWALWGELPLKTSQELWPLIPAARAYTQYRITIEMTEKATQALRRFFYYCVSMCAHVCVHVCNTLYLLNKFIQRKQCIPNAHFNGALKTVKEDFLSNHGCPALCRHKATHIFSKSFACRLPLLKAASIACSRYLSKFDPFVKEMNNKSI